MSTTYDGLNHIRKTQNQKHLSILRAIAAIPLLLFGVLHLIDPAPFRDILLASGIPFVELNLILAPLAEIAAGALLLSGFFSRLGGLLGAATMATAIYSTLVLAGLSGSQLPAGIASVPEVPPLVLPVVVLVASIYVAWRGAGAWSLDLARAGAR